MDVPQGSKPKSEQEYWKDVDEGKKDDQKFTWGAGKAFIEYQTEKQAIAAEAALRGKVFSGRTVITSFFPVDRYHKRQYTPVFEQEFEIKKKYSDMRSLNSDQPPDDDEYYYQEGIDKQQQEVVGQRED